MNLNTTAAPHIHGKNSIAATMRQVLIALVPTLLVGIYVFGFRALLVALVSMAASVAAEALLRLLTHKPQTVMDGSAAVTGLLLALTLPVNVPYWVAAVGGVFAVVVVKGLGGGLGENIFNPALGARAFLLLLWPASVTRFAAPGAELPPFGSAVDAVTAGTPLHTMQMPALPEASLTEMFLGTIGGCIGEVSALALIAGGIYLVVRKVISPRIPLAYLGSVALLTLVFSKGENPVAWMLYSLLGGGVMLGAIFMATDYATSPVNAKGQIVYGVGCGVLTVFFRYYGLFPEGVTYSILIMNAVTWLLDKAFVPQRFGTGKGGTAK